MLITNVDYRETNRVNLPSALESLESYLFLTHPRVKLVEGATFQNLRF